MKREKNKTNKRRERKERKDEPVEIAKSQAAKNGSAVHGHLA